MKLGEVLDIFKKKKALLDGHFLLSSGLHSAQYLQCALVLQDPLVAEMLCRSLADKIKPLKVDLVVGPAMGGIVLAYELARALKVRAIFTERQEQKMCLRRGFSIAAGEKVLVAEDVVTTGGSVKEVIETVKSYGADVVAVAALIDRSGGMNPFDDIPLKALHKIRVETYESGMCPLCQAGLPLVKPGSRGPALHP